MKLNRKQLRKLIMESLDPDKMTKDEDGFDRNQQNKDIEQGLYDYFAAFLEAPEDKKRLNHPGFGFRMNVAVDSKGMKVLTGTVQKISPSRNKNVTHVYCYLSDSVLGTISGVGTFGNFKKKRALLEKAINNVKRKTGNTDVTIEIGMTGNSVQYHGGINDDSVYTINRID